MRALVASLAISVLLVAACGDDDAPVAVGGGGDPTTTQTVPEVSAGSEQARLDAARQRWEEAGIEDYRLTWTVQCFCPRTTFIDTIVDGAVVSHEQGPDSDALHDPGPKTVPDVFDEVQAAIDEEPATLDVTYDGETGAVTSWWADYQLNMADEEQGLEVELELLDEGEAPTEAPAFDAAALTVSHPCGNGFQIGSPDQRVGLFLHPVDGAAQRAGAHVVPGGAWTATVRLGQDLFANWCDDVLEPDEPRPAVHEEWEVVEGAIDVVLPPEEEPGPATLTATGLVAERPNGERVPIGDITIDNERYGLFAG